MEQNFAFLEKNPDLLYIRIRIQTVDAEPDPDSQTDADSFMDTDPYAQHWTERCIKGH